MMMTSAMNSGPGPEALSAATIEAVRGALTAYVAEPVSGEALRSALHALSSEARKKSILPEQLLITLKDVWYSLPAVQTITEPNEQMRLLQRVVTICVKEYYLSQ